METLASALEREHREIDAAIAAGHLQRAFDALRRHIYLEEEFLFPPMRDAGFVAPIFVMLREHGELWRTMESIESASAGPVNAPPDACRALLAQLETHNAKEEAILYTHADGVLDAPAGGRLLEYLANARRPDGWACRRAAA